MWSKIEIDQATQCWIWKGTVSGTPQIRWKVGEVWKAYNARRLVYEAAFGPTTAEAVGGCKLTCLNPTHVIAGTHDEVSGEWHRRHPTGVTKSDLCKHGHVLAVVGVYTGRSGAKCRACQALLSAAQKAAERAERVAMMTPDERAAHERRSQAAIERWATGRQKRQDGSLSFVVGGKARDGATR